MTHKNYRCCFTDGDDRVLKTETIDGTDDASAVLQVERLLVMSPHSSAELWDGERLVGRWAAATRENAASQDLSAVSAQ